MNAPLLTVDDVAEQLRVTPTWVAAAALKGEISSRKIGRARRFLQDDIDEYLASHRHTAVNPLALSNRSVSRLRSRRAS